MASEQQILANRRNARKSTGPKSEQGKRRSCRNALRQGLTADAIVDGLEDLDAYRRFAAAIYSEYAPRTPFHQTLVSRLASLLWRLRQAASIEIGLLQIQAEILQERRMQNPSEISDHIDPMAKLLVRPAWTAKCAKNGSDGHTANGVQEAPLPDAINLGGQTHLDLARCFLRVANLDNGLFERIGCYEARLWRLVVQKVVAIDMRNTTGA
jgi:hypothetical protein